MYWLRDGKSARCNLVKKQTVSLAFFSWAKGRSGLRHYKLNFIDFSLYISRVKQVVRFFAAWFAEVGLVELLDCRILVGLTDGFSCVFVV